MPKKEVTADDDHMVTIKTITEIVAQLIQSYDKGE